tara:strand:+ start:790 stop:1194 length:405 start_codon:yes stop_codon:yes gene_type:complete
MKKLLYILLILPLFFISSCKEDIEGCTDSTALNYDIAANTDDGSCLSFQGDVIFYTIEDGGCGAINVYIENEFIGSITSYITNEVTPECGADGFATGTVDVGDSRAFTATCGLYTWEGTISISPNECASMQLNF